MKVIRSLGGAAIARSRGFLKKHGKVKLLLYGLPILALLWALGGALGFLGGVLQFLARIVGPLVVTPGGRFLVLNLGVIAFLWIFYRRFRFRFRRTLALASLKNFLAGLRATAGRDPGHAVARFKAAARWARLVPEEDMAKCLPEIPDILAQSQIRLALSLAETGALEDALRALLRARVSGASKETRRALEEAQALLYARHPDVLEETVEAGLRSAMRAHPRSVPILRELRDQLVRAGRFEEAAEKGSEIVPLVEGKTRETESRALSRLHLLVAGKAAEKGEAKAARLALRRAAELLPDDPFSALLLGDLEARAGNVAAALREWGRSPSVPALDRVRELLDRGELTPAEAIAGVPVAGSVAEVARHYLARGDVERARRAARIALDVAGPDPGSLVVLGDAAARSGHRDEAERHYAAAFAAVIDSPVPRDAT